MSAIEVANLHKTYKLGKVEVPVLRGVSNTVFGLVPVPSSQSSRTTVSSSS